MNMIPPILKLDAAGMPIEWLHWQDAVTLYARDRVNWEAGETRFTIRGGQRCDGYMSSIDVNSIIAVDSCKSKKARRVPPLTNAALFRRDGYLCMYCGNKFLVADLSRDHVHPVGRGGKDIWKNVLTACRRCNRVKDCRTPEEAGMLPLALPYEPDHARYLLLIASGRVTGCQQMFLEALSKTGRRAN